MSQGCPLAKLQNSTPTIFNQIQHIVPKPAEKSLGVEFCSFFCECNRSLVSLDPMVTTRTRVKKNDIFLQVEIS